MTQLKTIHDFRLSKEFLLKRLEKFLERGCVYRQDFRYNEVHKLKELGLIIYNDKKTRYDINLDIYKKLCPRVLK